MTTTLSQIAVGDTGTLIDLDITEPDANGNQVATTFDLLDDVVFVFVQSDGTRVAKSGLFITPSKARYELVSGDITVAGLMKIQLQIDTTPSAGTATPWIGSSSILQVNVIEKL